jgi:hypothetical protein
MQKHLSALEPRIETMTLSMDLESEPSCTETGPISVPIAVPVDSEQLHSRALAELIGVIEEQWRFYDDDADDEESTSDVPRATDCSQRTEEEDGYYGNVPDHPEEENLFFVDLEDMSIRSLLEITVSTTKKRRPPTEATTFAVRSPRVAAIKSFSIFRGEFPLMED